jgi:hypothetical protein
MNRPAAFAAANPGRRNSASGIAGLGARRSHDRNADTRIAPAASVASTSALPHPAASARTSAHVMASEPAAASTTPGTSIRARGPKLSLSRAGASATTASPTGTLTQKIHCQPMPSTIAPPISGPSAAAIPAIAPHMPIAAPRRWTGKASLISVSVSGNAIAAPAPCATRAAISAPTLGDSAAAADAAVNSAIPAVNIRRRPKRSPSAAPVSSRQAKASRYAFTVHSSPDRPACRLARTCGSAAVTTMLSSAVMKIPRPVRPTVQRRVLMPVQTRTAPGTGRRPLSGPASVIGQVATDRIDT